MTTQPAQYDPGAYYAAETIRQFARAVEAVPVVRKVAASPSIGPSVDFVLLVEGEWDDAIDLIAPATVDIQSSRPLTYRVAELASGEAVPAGYLVLIDR